MLKENTRICDLCGEEIPKGTVYHVENLSPEATAVFLEVGDVDLVPTWTQNPDGTVRLDICLDCYLSMGHPPDMKEMN
ncbi:MAG: hypothetical protein ACE5KJ_07805 [Candidatus Zixiibacteriota bacterium]